VLLRIRSLIVKELLAVWRDPKSRFILIGPPLIQMVIFSFAATLEVKNVPVAILNRDYGTHGRDLIARLQGSPNFTRIEYLSGNADVAPAIDARRALMVVHIGPDFSRNLDAGRPADVQLIMDGRRSNAAQLVAGYATAIIASYNEELARDRRAPPPPSEVVPRIWFNPNMDPRWSTVPGLVAILTSMMGIMVTGLSVARERELGTFEQLLVSPLSPTEIILGKTVPALLIGTAEATGMTLVGMYVFDVPFRGEAGLFYLSMVVYLGAVIGVGLFISSLARTQQQAILGAFVFMVPAILLSGFASPIENMPPWLQFLTRANPVRYFMAIVKGVFLKAMSPDEVLDNLWPLVVIAAATLATAAWLFRRRAA
jgi:drug efflux transport system permease protein